MYLELVGRLQILWTKSIWKEMSRTERCTQPSARDASPSPRGNCNSDASWPAEVLSKSFPSSPVACFAWFCENWSFSLLVLSPSQAVIGGRIKLPFSFFPLPHMLISYIYAVLAVDNSSVCETQTQTVLLTNNKWNTPVLAGISLLADSWVRHEGEGTLLLGI